MRLGLLYTILTYYTNYDPNVDVIATMNGRNVQIQNVEWDAHGTPRVVLHLDQFESMMALEQIEGDWVGGEGEPDQKRQKPEPGA